MEHSQEPAGIARLTSCIVRSMGGLCGVLRCLAGMGFLAVAVAACAGTVPRAVSACSPPVSAAPPPGAPIMVASAVVTGAKTSDTPRECLPRARATSCSLQVTQTGTPPSRLQGRPSSPVIRIT